MKKFEAFGKEWDVPPNFEFPFWAAQDPNGLTYAYQSEPRKESTTGNYVATDGLHGYQLVYLGYVKQIFEVQKVKIESWAPEVSEPTPEPQPEPEPTDEPWRVTERFISFKDEYENWKSIPITAIERVEIHAPTLVDEQHTVSIHTFNHAILDFKVQKPQDFIDKLP